MHTYIVTSIRTVYSLQNIEIEIEYEYKLLNLQLTKLRPAFNPNIQYGTMYGVAANRTPFPQYYVMEVWKMEDGNNRSQTV